MNISVEAAYRKIGVEILQPICRINTKTYGKEKNPKYIRMVFVR
jgi:hypothetical protein